MIQTNNPDDLTHAMFNQSQREQQAYLSQLSGGSWSHPPWDGWRPMIGAGYTRYGNSDFLQRFAQDGDSGFFFRRGIFGGGEPIGSILPLNTLDDPIDSPPAEDGYTEPVMSTAEPVVPPAQDPVELEVDTSFTAEPQQRAVHVPPYSRLLYQGMGNEKDSMYEEPFVMPEYKGGFHKKKRKL